MNMQKHAGILRSLAAAAALAAVLGHSAAYADGPLVGSVEMVSQIEWFQSVEMGLRQAAKDHGGGDLLVGNAEGDLGKEAQAVDDLVARGIKGLVITTLDPKASVPALERAAAAGVKIVNYNTKIDSPLMTTYVSVDNKELGAQMGRYVADYVTKNMGGKAKIALLTVPDFAESRARRDGFVEEISKVPGIEIVAEQRGQLPDASATTLETIIQGHPDLQLVWSAVEGGTTGSIAARRSTGVDLKLFGTDMSLQVAGALIDPSSGLVAVSTQSPYDIGYKAMELLLDSLAGKDVKGTYDVPLSMYYADKPDDVKAYLEKYKSLAKAAN
jgi:simple sugar transport system substrate-binding protein/ribose transport system substrate-binding protein